MNSSEVLMLTACLLFGLAWYGLLVTRHLLKLVAILQVMAKALLLLLLGAGQANGNLALAQNMMLGLLTADTMLAVVALTLVVQIYRKTGSMDIRDLAKLKG